MQTHINIFIYANILHINIYAHMCTVHRHIRTHVYIYIYTESSRYIFISTYTYIYIFICIYIYIVTDRNLEYVLGNATKVPVYCEVPVAQIFFLGANRHNLPRICIEMVFSVFLRVLFGFFGECRHKGA